MQHFGFWILFLIAAIGYVGCKKIDPVLEPSSTSGQLQARLRNGDTLSVMTQLLTDAAYYSGTLIVGSDLVSFLDPQWGERFYLNDSVMLVPCNSLQRYIPFSWAYLYYNVDSTMGVYYYEFVPDRDFAFSFETTEDFMEDYTGWGTVYVIGEGIVDAVHYQAGVVDTIYVNESLSEAQVRGGDSHWWNTRWYEWIPMLTDGVGQGSPCQAWHFPICPNCQKNGKGSCSCQNCPYCAPGWTVLDFNELGNGGRPPVFSFDAGNNSGGIYNSGGSSSGANGIFSNIPSNFIDNWKQLDRECRNNIEQIQLKVGELSPEAWECLGQSCGVQEGANGAGSGGTSNSMTDDLLDVLNHELAGAKLVDPCNPNKPHEALMSELIVSLCGGEYLGRGDVLDQLEINDDIIVFKELGDCKKWNCTINRVIDASQNSPLDDPICPFSGSLGSVFIKLDGFSGEPKLPTDVKARTFFNENGISSIVFNSDVCNGDDHILQRASTIYHEFIHAEINLWLYNNGWVQGFGMYDSKKEMWNLYVQHNFPAEPINIDEHVLMSKYYIDRLAGLIHRFNNYVGEIDDYRYLAWLGLPSKDFNGMPLISQLELDQYEMRFIQNIWNNSNNYACP